MTGKSGVSVDADLKDRIFRYRFYVTPDYPEGPHRFVVVRQNGSRVHLRAIEEDGSWRRWPEGHNLAGSFLERSAYAGDVRHAKGGWVHEDAEVAEQAPR